MVFILKGQFYTRPFDVGIVIFFLTKSPHLYLLLVMMQVISQCDGNLWCMLVIMPDYQHTVFLLMGR